MAVNDDFLGFDEVEKSHERMDPAELRNNCLQLFAYFNKKFVEALAKCTKGSLDDLKKRLWTSRFGINICFFIFVINDCKID